MNQFNKPSEITTELAYQIQQHWFKELKDCSRNQIELFLIDWFLDNQISLKQRKQDE